MTEFVNRAQGFALADTKVGPVLWSAPFLEPFNGSGRGESSSNRAVWSIQGANGEARFVADCPVAIMRR